MEKISKFIHLIEEIISDFIDDINFRELWYDIDTPKVLGTSIKNRDNSGN